ncbi:molybdopterin molybdotransferase MoeA [Intrasporangium calvum]|uniref:Molybdopterin molybdenumtransferase n=1 Tax=Intrasporangium calvum TaxID=53358 RepID=A0ABT5GD82_9MICO|nr:gephyrin-like molybdotransferase Glp [Intrasporangium calvum]MDC5696231.1 molybdopterin molybdotransferase MoeA [Intrasporangium calvum]
MPHTSVAEHRVALRQVIGMSATETVALDRQALGRRLAEPLLAVDDLPRFDSSAMDGYAAAPATPDQLTFPVVGDVAAGDAARFALQPGQAARVMTGARLPAGAVGVVPVEQTDAARTGPAPDQVTFTAPVEPGRHIRPRAEDIAAGAPVGAAGTLVTAAVIALGRSAGCTAAVVHAPTRVAVVATGAELTAPGADPGRGGIHESNSEMVAALAASAGCHVTHVDTCTDDPELLDRLLTELDAAPDVDLVITTGGVSAGAYEVVRQVCEPRESFSFVHLAIQPGGPQGLGRWGATPVVCLPGTPVGAFVSFEMLVRPALDARHGAPPRRAGSAAYVGRTRHTRAGKVQFISCVIAQDGTVTAPDARHLSALAGANGLLEVPEAVDQIVAGDLVTVHPL